MPAKSVAQQRLFGVLHSQQQGKLKHPSAKIKSMAGKISTTSVSHFAGTKHKGLPKHVHHKSAADKVHAVLPKLLVARRAKYASVIADAATILAPKDARLTKVASIVSKTGNLREAIIAAYPDKRAHDALFRVLIKVASALWKQKQANSDLGVAGSGMDDMGGSAMPMDTGMSAQMTPGGMLGGMAAQMPVQEPMPSTVGNDGMAAGSPGMGTPTQPNMATV